MKNIETDGNADPSKVKTEVGLAIAASKALNNDPANNVK